MDDQKDSNNRHNLPHYKNYYRSHDSAECTSYNSQLRSQSSYNHSRSYQNRKRRKEFMKNNNSNNNGNNNGNNQKTINKNSQYKSHVSQRAEIIADYLEKVPLLARLSRNDRYNLGKTFKQKIFSKNQIVIKQNESGHEFYIITKGNASVIIKSEESEDIVAILHPGDYFGETALLTSKPRNATVKSNNTQLHCLVLDKNTFINVFGKDRVQVNFGKRGGVSAETHTSNKRASRTTHRKTHRKTEKNACTKELISSAIENNVLFAALDEDQIDRIVEEMWSLDIKKGDNIINQGEQGDNFYVVEHGQFNIYVTRNNNNNTDEKLVATRSTGESFGELALMYNSPRSATVRAITNCKVWAVERYMFRKILIRVSEQKLKEYENFLKHVPLLDSLLVNERRAVAEALNEVIYNEGDIIVEQGDIGQTFYIIKKGEAVVYKSVPQTAPATEVARLKKGSFFGERALIKNESRAATVQVITNKMTCLTLDREAFCLLLGPLAELMHRKIDEDYDGIKYKYDNNIINDYKNYYDNKLCEKKDNNNNNNNKLLDKNNDKLLDKNKNKKIKFDDLNIIGILGRGSFGSVELVQHIDSNDKTYALKTVSKAQIVRTGQQEHIISEKNVMMMLDSPFIVKLYETYNSDKYLYFLLEVVLGGELFTVLRARTVFDESTAQFYTASVVFAFDYMHSKSIIYRDLKPENLLLDSVGYLKITDFGFAKIINDRTYTLCGTPDYLAPEVISGAGHGFGVDWWTLGVLLFEMLASYPPFYHEDPMKTYAKIMYGRVNYPKHFTKYAVDIIKSFLNAKSTKRIGIIKGGINNIKNHNWFRNHNFNWDALYNQQMKAPIIPIIKHSKDRSNFEAPSQANGDDNEQEQKIKQQERNDAEKYIDDGSGWDKKF